MEDDYLYVIGLTQLDEIGDILAKDLVAYCGGIKAFYEEHPKNLAKIPGIGESRLAAMNRDAALKRAESILKDVQKYHLHVVSYLDDHYPERLKVYRDTPVCLYYQGHNRLQDDKMISIVGTRSPTSYGRKMCQRIIEGLRTEGLSIVSGLAYGVDSIAHQSALDSDQRTIAVLGNGLPDIYPSGHHSLGQKILSNGGTIISQFPPGTSPDRENFPLRNKVVAYISDCTLVIESKASGGSMITANFAFHNHKELFAVPGRSTDEYSEGCNALIKSNMAHLVQDAQDILHNMNWHRQKPRRVQRSLPLGLSDSAQAIYEHLNRVEEAHIDQLAEVLNSSQAALSAGLLELEISGLIRALAGKRYSLS